MGVLKWVLEPLSFMLVYFVLVGVVLQRSQPAFLLFLFCALVPFRYFTGVVFESMSLVHSFSEPISNRSFPKEVLPLVVLSVEGTTLGVAILLFAPFMALYRIVPTTAMLWLPVLVLVLALMTIGPTFLATLFGLYFPDFRGAAQNLTRLLFFASTGLVSLSHIPGRHLPLLLKYNPLSGIFDSFRAVVIDQHSPKAFDLLYPSAIGLALFVAGFLAYRAREGQFAKEV